MSIWIIPFHLIEERILIPKPASRSSGVDETGRYCGTGCCPRGLLTAVKIEHAYQQPVSVVGDPVYGGLMVIPLGRHQNPTSGLRAV
jgi:hypothetical protein